jgi:YfiH family protein
VSAEVTTRFIARFFDRNVNYTELPRHFDAAITFYKLKQVHGSDVAVITPENLHREIVADAAVTVLPDVGLTVHTADCLPLLAYGDGVIGACHGGWRGVSTGIIERWIATMGTLGAKKENIKVFIGPAIGVCHFEVGKDVAENIIASGSLPVKFMESIKKRHPDASKEYVDLKEVARFKLLRLGIQPSSITISTECTHCRPESYFSYRRDNANGNRMEAVIVKSQR